MSQPKPPYPAAFEQQIVELVASGRSIRALAAEFGCSAQSIHHCVSRAAIDRGEPPAGKEQALTSTERAELAALRRENRQLKLERDILSKATAWFANKSERTSTVSMS